MNFYSTFNHVNELKLPSRLFTEAKVRKQWETRPTVYSKWHWNQLELTQCLTYPAQMTTPNPTCIQVSLSQSNSMPNVSLKWRINNTKSLYSIIASRTLKNHHKLRVFFSSLHLNLIRDHLNVPSRIEYTNVNESDERASSAPSNSMSNCQCAFGWMKARKP